MLLAPDWIASGGKLFERLAGTCAGPKPAVIGWISADCASFGVLWWVYLSMLEVV